MLEKHLSICLSHKIWSASLWVNAVSWFIILNVKCKLLHLNNSNFLSFSPSDDSPQSHVIMVYITSQFLWFTQEECIWLLSKSLHNISIIPALFIEVKQHEIWIYRMALKFIEALQKPDIEMHRVFSPTGQVTNAAIIPAPGNMFLPDSRPGIPLPRFSRHLNNSEQAEGSGTGGMCLRLGTNCQVSSTSIVRNPNKQTYINNIYLNMIIIAFVIENL